MPEGGHSWNPFHRGSRRSSGEQTLQISSYEVALEHPFSTGCYRDGHRKKKTVLANSESDAISRANESFLPSCNDPWHEGTPVYYKPVSAKKKK